MSTPAPSIEYVMGHDDRERRRLALQAAVINDVTERLFERAGIAPGMRVLDVGCGIGEVSLLAARLVGPHGQVTGVDIDDVALATARRKAEQLGLKQVEFVHSDIRSFQPNGTVDAITGRHILIHTPDPLALLRAAHSTLNSGGVAVFHEYDFSIIHRTYPESPLRERMIDLFREFFGRALPGNMGTRLYHLFVEAGFPRPQCWVEYPIGGGADSPFYELYAESVRSILPRAEALGIVRGEDIEIDTLAERLRAEAVSLKSGIPGPPMIGCFGRKP
jgi:ubiquinone/menaquinone biosynthesis C-methylase UbiE